MVFKKIPLEFWGRSDGVRTPILILVVLGMILVGLGVILVAGQTIIGQYGAIYIGLYIYT